MKRYLIAPIAATIALSMTPKLSAAQVRTIQPHAFQSSEHVKLARTVDHLGVPIIDGSASGLRECEPKSNSITFGFYSPSHNAMVLCTSNGNLTHIQRTFVHETMHMVQDCRAGLSNASLQDKNGYLTKLQYLSLGKKHKHNINHLYEGSAKIFEVEARELEDHPNIVWKYLVKYCQ